MTGLVQSALGGGRALLVGWILPSLINVLIFGFVVVPKLSSFAALGTEKGQAAIFGLVATAVLGLVLAALQTPLYRVLEGYRGWPQWLAHARRRHHLARKHLLRNRVDALILAEQERAGRLAVADQSVLAAFRAHPIISRYLTADIRKGDAWFALLNEQLHRYPLDDRQVTPTRLGNAIRRFEEYGYDRYRLDSQVLWHELNAAVPDMARQQTDDARMSVDFFVSLLYGHLLVVAAAIADLTIGTAVRPWLVAATIAVLPPLTLLWYRLAVVATDEWAGAVRAMVNLGRHPLAAALGFTVPDRVEEERAMWHLASDLVRTGFHPGQTALNTYRTAPGEPSARGEPAPTQPTLPAARPSPAADDTSPS
ncbi:hypothetical protein BSZ07_02910 [Streptomyces sp. M1013]|uniref:hypothetical protein n=1 Tax=Streptomyces sp. M1013 TaxID=549798 RepID=UPI000978D7BA|nr:hypothetical protein [Streptomyces sp. M1013]OMI91838.1 hypothetical protein BSZ07_02910 [Streptomyces sp. M1013]